MSSSAVTRPRILVITPVAHIAGVSETLEGIGEVMYFDDPSPADVAAAIGDYHAIYTNPNKSKVFLGRDVLVGARQLQVICTASTGTNHIDKAYAASRGVAVLSLTDEREVIERISSTAELAFALTLASVRHVVAANDAVRRGEWDYLPYVGRQLSGLTIGVIGCGRLGTKYVRYCRAFDARVLVFDPYKTVADPHVTQVATLEQLLRESDVIALHVHVTPETTGMIARSAFELMKPEVVLVNTSRGEIVNEADAVAFLQRHPRARIATDVLADEIRARGASPLLRHAATSAQVVITPHIGGMSREAQEIAYGHAAAMLRAFFAQRRA